MREPWSQYSSKSHVSSTGAGLLCCSAGLPSAASSASLANSQANLAMGSLNADAASSVLTRLG